MTREQRDFAERSEREIYASKAGKKVDNRSEEERYSGVTRTNKPLGGLATRNVKKTKPAAKPKPESEVVSPKSSTVPPGFTAPEV